MEASRNKILAARERKKAKLNSYQQTGEKTALHTERSLIRDETMETELNKAPWQVSLFSITGLKIRK